MKQKDLTLDLFIVLKREADTHFLDIINGTYVFSDRFSYLNRVPIEVRNLIIEKIMYICTEREYQDEENPIVYLNEFLDKFVKMSKNQLKGNLLIELKYAKLMRDLKKTDSKIKKRLQKTFLSLLFTVLLATSFEMQTIGEDTPKNFSNDDAFGETTQIIVENAIAMASPIKPINKIISDTIEEKIEEPTNLTQQEEKIQKILIEQNLTREQFDVICAIVTAEAKPNSYEDAYCVINTMYNRINSKNWVNYVTNISGIEGAGNNLYYQATLKGQFVVYEEGRYLEFLGNQDTVGYQAVIDMLTSKECIHDYLSFRSANTQLDDYNQIVENGNKYFNALEENDRIEKVEIKK